jgi:pyrimidine-nucleoside phosphorylase
MVDLCKAVGRGCTALITDMDAPLGYAVGNAVEVSESIDVLRGGGPADVRELTLLLGVEMLIAGEAPGLAGTADPVAEARRLLESALADGSALQRFIALVEAQGGDPRCIEDPSRLPRPKAVRELRADRSGYLVALDAEAVGLAAVELGAGRARKEDKVDPAAGLLLRKRVGDDVRQGEVLAELHARDGERLEAGAKRLRTAVLIDASPPAPRALLIDRIA